MGKNPQGVRRGAWTKEEDILLKNCIQNFGEGNWHKVPLKAGLNRCRKSCRLRWLNYLRPNIKRGPFTNDEVDLIARLHKLIGNRWSLIAGRLPGRTGNDIKNFWNTYTGKKTRAAAVEHSKGKKAMITKSNIIRPRPWTFTKFPKHSSDTPKGENPCNNHNNNNNVCSIASSSSKYSAADYDKNRENELPSSSSQQVADDCIRWWGDLLERTSFLFSDEGGGTATEPMPPP